MLKILRKDVESLANIWLDDFESTGIRKGLSFVKVKESEKLDNNPRDFNGGDVFFVFVKKWKSLQAEM